MIQFGELDINLKQNKSTTIKSFVLIYVIIGIIGIISVYLIAANILYHSAYKKKSDILYRQANSIADIYGNDLYSDDSNKRNSAISSLYDIAGINDTRLMVISGNGDAIADSYYKSDSSKLGTTLYQLSAFDSTRLGGEHVWMGYFYNVFSERTMSVFSPITSDFTTKGYVVLNYPYSSLRASANEMIFGPLSIFIIMYALAFIFIWYYWSKIHIPITETMEAIKAYKKGDFNYSLNTNRNSDIGQLEATISDMSDKIRASDKAQKEFLSNISHDFRSPLTSIKGYLTAIQDGTIPPEMMGKYLDIVLFETNRLTGLTENILTLNELHPTSVKLEYSDFDVNTTIRHTIETMEGFCAKRGIHFLLNFCAQKTFIHADKSKYQQVIYNLVDNAIKFSPDNFNIEISVLEKEGKAYISVRDYGCGIEEKDIDKIWNRMYKTDASRGLNKKSSGLGLSITRGIIQAHDETITVESDSYVGTKFTFTANLSDVNDLDSESDQSDSDDMLHIE